MVHTDSLVNDFRHFVVEEARRRRLLQRLRVELDDLHPDVGVGVARKDLLNDLRRPIGRNNLGDVGDPAFDPEIGLVAAVKVHAV